MTSLSLRPDWKKQAARLRPLAQRRRQGLFVPQLECLEDRCLLTGGITPHTLPAGSFPAIDAVLGPDGNTWYSRFWDNRIGKITPSGTVTEYQLPGTVFDASNPGVTFTNKTPESLAVGPDGNIWFVEGLTGSLARITPAGVITEQVPGSFQGELGSEATAPIGYLPMVPGSLDYKYLFGVNADGSLSTFNKPVFHPPVDGNGNTLVIVGRSPYTPVFFDGAIWYGDGNAIAQLSLTGTVVEYSLSNSNATASSLAVGGDGNLWFVEGPNSTIARITPAGVITEFASLGLPEPNESDLSALTADNSGSLWFSDTIDHVIYRVATVDGTTTQYTLPAGLANVVGVVPGLNADLWISVMATNPGDPQTMVDLSIDSLASGSGTTVTTSQGTTYQGVLATLTIPDLGNTVTIHAPHPLIFPVFS
jgi:streptogramin lyase